MKKIYKRHRSSNFRIFLPTIVQIPMFIMVSLALRSMTGWPGWFDIGMGVPVEPLLHTEGLGPIKDLTRPDGTFVLPVLVGLLNVINVQVYHKAHLSCDSELTLIQVTDAKRSITFTNPIAARIRSITKFSLITLSAVMIPVAMQAPAVVPPPMQVNG
jgi:membrane protein insertase Oxa1/YidC/SpoIIIJ